VINNKNNSKDKQAKVNKSKDSKPTPKTKAKSSKTDKVKLDTSTREPDKANFDDENELRWHEEIVSARIDSGSLYELTVAVTEDASALEALVADAPTDSEQNTNIYAIESIAYNSYSKYQGAMAEEGIYVSVLTDTEKLIEKKSVAYQASKSVSDEVE